ncbi:MAG: transglutaminase domain-containing protein [Bacteroidetes bacterium]|nr:transglutaminase domain-containing protein [Bacteroidota bacterium]
MKTITFLISFSFAFMAANAQAYEKLDYYLNKYPGDNVVNSLVSTHLVIDYGDNGEPKVWVTETERSIYLKDNAASFSSGSVTHSEHYKIKALEAYSLIPNGNKFKKLTVNDFATKTEFSPGIFHNGTESLNFIFPSLSKGANSVVEHTMELSIPQLLSGFYIQDYYPTERMEITIEAAEGIELEFSYINASEEIYQPTITENKKGKVYKWVLTDIPAFEYDNDAPSITYYTPHIVPRISSYQKDGKKVNLLTNIDDLYHWYYSLIEQTDKSANDEIKAVVDSLTKDVTDEWEKISRIYYWAQDNIRYVAFEEGMQGFIPENAEKVCNRKYGDCKGITSLLYTMMQEAGIETYFTWVGTRDRPYRYEDVPAPIVDNHMILTYKKDGQYFFIDGTSNTSPIGEPTAFIQGKEVLIAIDKNEYEVVEVPVHSYDYTTYSDTVFLTLEEESGSLKGKGKSVLSGFYNTRLKGYLKLSSKDEQKRFLEEYLEKGHNKFELDTFQVSDITNRIEALKIDYDFSLADYVSKNDDELYVNLTLDKTYSDFNLNPKRKVPYEKPFKSKNDLTVILDIPDGYVASYIPENQEFKQDKFGFSFNVQQQGNQIIQKFTVYDDFLLLGKENFDDWNKMIRSIKKVNRESVILNKIN